MKIFNFSVGGIEKDNKAYLGIFVGAAPIVIGSLLGGCIAEEKSHSNGWESGSSYREEGLGMRALSDYSRNNPDSGFKFGKMK